MTPPPANGRFNNINNDTLNNHVPSIIYEIAHRLGYPKNVIDLFTSMGGAQKRNYPDLFFDFVHPNDAGNIQMAYTIYKSVFQGFPRN